MQAARLAERSARTQLTTANMAIKVSLLKGFFMYVHGLYIGQQLGQCKYYQVRRWASFSPAKMVPSDASHSFTIHLPSRCGSLRL